MRTIALFGYQLFYGGTASAAFEVPGLFVEALQRAEFFVAPELRFLNGGLQHADGLVIDFERHREGMTILAAECE
jgi:hypothetical protein